MPVPALVRAPVPVIVPDTEVDELSPPAVNVYELKDIVPAPAIDPIVSLAPKA